MRYPSLIALAATTTLALSGCGNVNDAGGTSSSGPVESKAASEVTIGFAQRQLDAPYYSAMESAAEAKAQADGFTLVFQNASGDPVTQLDQVQAMLAQDVDAIVVNAISPETQRTQLEQVAGEVPLLFVDTAIPDVGITAVGSDNKEIGRLSGLLTAKRLGDGATVQVGVLDGGPNDEIVGPARQSGFLAGLEEGGVTAEVVASATATYSQEEAIPATESMLVANPEIDLVFGLNDAMALGALTVLRNQGNTTILVAGVDGQKEALAAISEGGCEGQYVSTGLNSPSIAVEEVLDIALKIATGAVAPADVEGTTITEPAGIGCDNIGDFYDPESVF